MISYTVGYGPKYAGRSYLRMRATAPRRVDLYTPPPLRRPESEWLAGTLFVVLQALIVGLAIATTA